MPRLHRSTTPAVLLALVALLCLPALASAAVPAEQGSHLCPSDAPATCQLTSVGEGTGEVAELPATPGQVTAVEPLALTDPACDAEVTPGASAVQEPEWLATSCCRSECVRDRDCDAICGAKGAGVCIALNSCCRGCACTF